jgi:hypothetical protein
LSVLRFQTNVEARISVRPIELIELGKARERRCAEDDLEQLLHERRLGDLLALGERADECFHLGRHTTLDESVGWHESDRVTKAAGRLSCIASVFAQKLNIQNAQMVDPTAVTPTDSVSAPYPVNGL